MTKIQKVLLWASVAFFIVPEFLWNPLGNIVYSLFMPTVNGSSQILRDSFILNYSFESLYKIILLVQLIGIIVFTISWMRSKNNLKSKLTYWVVLLLSIMVSVLTLCIVYLAYAISQISFP